MSFIGYNLFSHLASVKSYPSSQTIRTETLVIIWIKTSADVPAGDINLHRHNSMGVWMHQDLDFKTSLRAKNLAVNENIHFLSITPVFMMA